MEFGVRSKKELIQGIENNILYPDALIVISNTDDKDSEPLILSVMRGAKESVPEENILFVNFDDVLEQDRNHMTDEDAKKIIEFIDEFGGTNNGEIIVSCDGGVSRSASVVMFFDFEENHSVEFFLNLRYSPNPHVINTLRKNFKNAQITKNLIEELSMINLSQFKSKNMEV